MLTCLKLNRRFATNLFWLLGDGTKYGQAVSAPYRGEGTEYIQRILRRGSALSHKCPTVKLHLFPEVWRVRVDFFISLLGSSLSCHLHLFYFISKSPFILHLSRTFPPPV